MILKLENGINLDLNSLHLKPSFKMLILAFHGYGERAESMSKRLDFLKDNQNCLVICVQAPHVFEIESRKGSERWSEIEKWGYSWMFAKTRTEDIECNRLNTVTLMNVLKAQIIWEKLVILGHSQGASHAWRVASWVGGDLLVAHAGDLPPELRKQWPKVLRESGIKVLMSRGEKDKIYSDEIFKRDNADIRAKIAEGVKVDLRYFEHKEGHAWTGDWGEFLERFFRAIFVGELIDSVA